MGRINTNMEVYRTSLERTAAWAELDSWYKQQPPGAVDDLLDALAMTAGTGGTAAKTAGIMARAALLELKWRNDATPSTTKAGGDDDGD